MDDDLKGTPYQGIYILTFIFVFCLVPLVFVIVRGDLGRGERQYNCSNPVTISKLNKEEGSKSVIRYTYELEDGSKFTSTLSYAPGTKVCKYK